MVSGVLVSDRILYYYLYRKFDQLYLGCGSRDVCAGMVIQYWNDSFKWRGIDGGILLRKQDYFPGRGVNVVRIDGEQENKTGQIRCAGHSEKPLRAKIVSAKASTIFESYLHWTNMESGGIFFLLLLVFSEVTAALGERLPEICYIDNLCNFGIFQWLCVGNFVGEVQRQ